MHMHLRICFSFSAMMAAQEELILDAPVDSSILPTALMCWPDLCSLSPAYSVPLDVLLPLKSLFKNCDSSALLDLKSVNCITSKASFNFILMPPDGLRPYMTFPKFDHLFFMLKRRHCLSVPLPSGRYLMLSESHLNETCSTMNFLLVLPS